MITVLLLASLAIDPGAIADEMIAQGHYREALPILEAALSSAEKDGDSNLAVVLNNLGVVYWRLGRLRDAQHAYERAIAVRTALGETHTRAYAQAFNNLGVAYTDLKEYSKAIEALTHAVELHRELSADDAPLARAWGNLGLAYQGEHRTAEAEALFRKALAAETGNHAGTLNNLGVLLYDSGRLEEAEPVLRAAVSDWERELGRDHPQVAIAAANLGALYTEMRRYPEAEECYQRALRIAASALPSDHPQLVQFRAGYAKLLRRLDRKKEARRLEESARASQGRHAENNAMGFTVDARALK
jgi:tetratricopeptide (TPR) repeat protein